MDEFAIETSGLSRRFGRVVAVDRVDLKVPMGSVYGYLGRNGAGKTTTIQMLMGMIDRGGGTVRVMGYDPTREDVAMKRVVSYVPERVHLYDWMTVRQLLWFGAKAHPHWDRELAEQLRQRFELPAERKLGHLSRGMQGKAALLAALSSHPRLLILDDPTLGLDALVRREFMESIVGALQETGTTVFFSSHMIDDVERVCDWVGILHEGRLIVQAPLEKVKCSVKRLVVVFPEPAPPLTLPGVIEQRVEGRTQALVCEDFSERLVEQARAAGAVSVLVEDCSLEDVFVAYVRTPRGGSAQPAMVEASER
jgi:ABC-2 type transport system ATP-binding protein